MRMLAENNGFIKHTVEVKANIGSKVVPDLGRGSLEFVKKYCRELPHKKSYRR